MHGSDVEQPRDPRRAPGLCREGHRHRLGRPDAGVGVLGVVLMRSAGNRTLAEVEGASVRGRRQPLRHRDDDPTNAEGLLGALLLTNPACTSRRIFFYLRWISTLASPT